MLMINYMLKRIRWSILIISIQYQVVLQYLKPMILLNLSHKNIIHNNIKNTKLINDFLIMKDFQEMRELHIFRNKKCFQQQVKIYRLDNKFLHNTDLIIGIFSYKDKHKNLQNFYDNIYLYLDLLIERNLEFRNEYIKTYLN